MVAEGTVIGVLLDRHQLDGIVTQPGDPGENLVRKLAVRMHAPFFPAHAYMRFIHERSDPGRSW